MSSTSMTTSNSLAVKLFEKKTWIQMMQKSCLGHLFNRGCIYFPEELLGKDAKGDQVTFAYVGKLTNVPIGEGGTLDGNEEALDLENHAMAMNVSRLGVLSPNTNTIEQQRTKVNFNASAVEALKRRAVELMDSSVWNQLAGFNPSGSFTLNGTTYTTAAQKLHVQGHNTPVAPTTNRIIRAGSQANDQSLTSSNIMALDLIDYALEKISSSDQPIERLDGETYDLYLAPEQIVDLQQNSSAKIKWYDMQFNKLAGNQGDATIEKSYKNGMVCAGRYRNVFIYEAPRIPNGVNSSDSSVVANTKRAVLVGRDALSFASPFGGRVTDSDVPMKMFSQLKDYDYFKGQEGRLLYGLKKMSPSNKEDIGVLVIATYAAAHS
jgi:hypothetical protein